MADHETDTRGYKKHATRPKKDKNFSYDWMVKISEDLEAAGATTGAIKKFPDETRFSQSTAYGLKAGQLDSLHVGVIEKICQLLQVQPSELFQNWIVDLKPELAAPKIEEYKEKKRNEQENQ